MYVIVLAISPWLLLALTSDRFFEVKKPPIRVLSYTEEINTLQGQASSRGIKGGKFIVNKFFVISKDALSKYFESFDTKFLFFEGGLDLVQSTKKSGEFYFSFLIFFVYGVYSLLKNFMIKKYAKVTLFSVLILSPLPAVFISTRYEVVTHIPQFIVMSIFVSYGFLDLIKHHRKFAIIMIFLLLFEYFNLYHDLLFHYPGRYDSEIIRAGKNLKI